jgi:hypothetical protein
MGCALGCSFPLQGRRAGFDFLAVHHTRSTMQSGLCDAPLKREYGVRVSGRSPQFTQWLNSEARACKALQCWCNSSLGVQLSGRGSLADHVPRAHGQARSIRAVQTRLSGRKSAADGRAWNSEAAGASPAVLTIFACQAHEDERRPDKPREVGSNPTAGTKHAGSHGVRPRCQRSHSWVRLPDSAPSNAPAEGR